MRRRDFITLLGARPVATHTQQRNPIPPITPWWGTENDPQANARQHPLSPARDSVGSRFGGHAMKTNGTDMRLAITVLALGVSLLAIPTPLWAQKTASIAR